MKRALVIALASAVIPIALAAPASAAEAGRAGTYQLTGDEGVSKFEGIGVDARRGAFYVSEVTGGEIHRGTASGPPRLLEAEPVSDHAPDPN